jgi:hypothetical protein
MLRTVITPPSPIRKAVVLAGSSLVHMRGESRECRVLGERRRFVVVTR